MDAAGRSFYVPSHRYRVTGALLPRAPPIPGAADRASDIANNCAVCAASYSRL